MIWSLLVFPCLSFRFPSCFHAFPVTISVGFLSAFDSFPPFLSFLLLLHLHSCHAYVFLWFLSACKLNSLSSFCIFIRRLRLSVWFCVLERSQNEGKNEGKIHDKQLGMDLARSWQAFFPILLLLRQLLPPPRGLVMLLLQVFVLPPPAKHQHHHHHCDDCW